MKKTLQFALQWGAVMVIIATALSFLGRFYWFFELFTSFKLQYTFCLLICIIGLTVIKKRLMAVICAAFLIPNLLAILPTYNALSYDNINQGNLRVTSINLLSSNYSYFKVETYIENTKPDILVLEEYHERWEQGLERVLENYPYQYTVPRFDNFGIAIFSNTKLTSKATLELNEAEIPSLLCSFMINNEEVHLLATHPPPPMSSTKYNLRNEQLKEIENLGATLKNLIIIGDLNLTPYCHHFESLLNHAHIKDTRAGFGIQPTWPVWGWPLSIPLDHCLISNDIITINRSIGPDVGSDHYPVTVDLLIPSL
ncbi:endonuclease/exonuclease/phosphatase family protein [Fulvivirga maritima]|uniref:endonuclease/exonuclease/phosphatase family protein n=1 Tax=Fulvivirga maritima TaxID=2904247 RepID=UPI001F30E62A|nr:endonuclease/exonuclease/phosphatase family protein [Fulvivirga maritima]UII26548.1 endonuclease/exonuclease/phosphatase family protein [Fulvivirga maritima]